MSFFQGFDGVFLIFDSDESVTDVYDAVLAAPEGGVGMSRGRMDIDGVRFDYRARILRKNTPQFCFF